MCFLYLTYQSICWENRKRARCSEGYFLIKDLLSNFFLYCFTVFTRVWRFLSEWLLEGRDLPYLEFFLSWARICQSVCLYVCMYVWSLETSKMMGFGWNFAHLSLGRIPGGVFFLIFKNFDLLGLVSSSPKNKSKLPT